MTTPQGYMNKHLYKKIVNQLPDKTVIVPFFRGESTLHKHFPQMMKQLHRFNEVQLATNGDFLTFHNRQAILKNVTFFSLSLHDEAHPEHRQIKFLKQCRKAGIETQVSFVGELENRLGFMAHWRRHVDRIRIYLPHSGSGFGSMVGCNPPPEMCHKPFSDMIAYWNGRVGLCNHDWNNQVNLGNLWRLTVEEIWGGVTYNQIRQKKRCEVPVCVNCSFEKDKVYGEIIECSI